MPDKTTLSSDRLEKQFGPTHVEVLQQSAQNRTICTRVVASGQRLELSRVAFFGSGMERFPDIHRQILDGESMGKAFRNAEVRFERHQKASQAAALPSYLKNWFGSDGQGSVVQVSIYIGDERIHYADITEIYSPAVTWESSVPIAAHSLGSIIEEISGFLRQGERQTN